MKTAMQELIELIRFTDKECYATMFNEGLFDKALEKEKEQIIEAINTWCSDDNILTPEQYYNQTYQQEIEKL
jgi:hypothetical protein